MSKKMKILIPVVAAVLALAILVLVLALVGFRLSSKHTLEDMWRDEAVISTDDYDFYYTTADLHGSEAQQIKAFRAVKKSGFLRRAATADQQTVRRLVINGTDTAVGSVTTFEGDEQYYHFFSLSFDIPAELESLHTTNTFTANGAEVETLHHSYFVTDAELSTLSICGIELKFAN